MLIRDISGKKSSSGLVTPEASLRPGEFFAVKDVSFEVRRGELRTLGRSEKEISEKCLGATKVPDSGRRRHQCLGLIGHNGAGTQTAWQPLGRLSQVAHRVRRRGKARINTTLLKMLNGLIKPDAGSITMRGRVGGRSLRSGPPSLDARLWRLDTSSHQWLCARPHEKGTKKLRVSGSVSRVKTNDRRLGSPLMMPSTLDSGHSTLPIYRHAGAELFLGDGWPLGVRRCHGARSRCVDRGRGFGGRRR